MSRLFFIAVMSTVSLNLFAQAWTPGTVVTTSGDSVRCEIFFKDWDISPAFIETRGMQQPIDGAAIRAFKINRGSRTFEQVDIQLTYYKRSIEFPESPVERVAPTKVFAELIYSDPLLRLYSLGDDNQAERFLLKKGDEAIIELENYSYRTVRANGIFLDEKPLYKSQLAQLVSDCDTKIKTDISYLDKDIIRVLNKYSECKGVAGPSKAGVPQGLFNIGAFVGMGPMPNGSSRVNPVYHMQSTAGISVQMLSKKTFGNRFLQVDFGYATTKEVKSKFGLQLYDNIYGGVFGGTFFGKGKWQGMVFTGVSTGNGVLDTGVGVAFSKKVQVTFSAGLLNLIDAYTVKLKYYPRFKAPRSES